ncbi:MAG: hypothetical protein ACYTDU_15720 [Planctomycetota bacterium]
MGARRKQRTSKDPNELERVTVGIPRALIERARNCAFHEPGMTLAALVRDGLQRVICRYEKGNGGRYPARRGDLPRGRTVR